MNRWVAGARPRTLTVGAVPVVVGTAVAAHAGDVVAWRAVAALIVALGLQVGTNYANDYSDGVRGTDDARVGPLRLTATGLATPAQVKTAAVAAFAVAALAGLVLAVAVDLRLLAVGAAALLAGVFYTGGSRPYGYSGLGEVAVFVFFGFAATAGTAYVQLETLPGVAVLASLPVGLLACAVLAANNLRDLDSDRAAGKRTLAVRLGPTGARRLFEALAVGGPLSVALIAPAAPGALLGLAALPPAFRVVSVERAAAAPAELLPVLAATARLQVIVALLLSVGLWLT